MRIARDEDAPSTAPGALPYARNGVLTWTPFRIVIAAMSGLNCIVLGPLTMDLLYTGPERWSCLGPHSNVRYLGCIGAPAALVLFVLALVARKPALVVLAGAGVLLAFLWVARLIVLLSYL